MTPNRPILARTTARREKMPVCEAILIFFRRSWLGAAPWCGRIDWGEWLDLSERDVGHSHWFAVARAARFRVASDADDAPWSLDGVDVDGEGAAEGVAFGKEVLGDGLIDDGDFETGGGVGGSDGAPGNDGD